MELSTNQISDDPIGWFDAMAEKALEVQVKTLRRILKQNCETEYLRKWLGEDFRVDDLEDSELECLYRNSVPLATHADFEPYIQRIADGDTNPVLTQQPITHLSITSGTTGGRKYVPHNQDYQESSRTSVLVETTFRSRVYPTNEGGKILDFMYCNQNIPKTKGGLTVGPASTLSLKNLAKDNKFSTNCSPWEIAFLGKHKQQTYCHLLLGLHFYETVEIVFSDYAYTMVQAFSSLKDLWMDLCHDLREGTLSSRIECLEMRQIVLDIISVSPNPSLASMIEDKCRELEGSNWFGLIPKLWPNAKYVCCIATGSMKLYAKKLKHYLSDLPMVCAFYTSSESFIGINASPSAKPENVEFSIVPYASYFEFIALHKEDKQVISTLLIGDTYREGKSIPLSQTKVGQEYEIVLTTFTGLYIYRLGDVVEVVDFHKKTPKLKFVCRSKACLSVTIDKTTEKDLEIVVERGSELLSAKATAELIDYTSHANLANQLGNYTIYWEIKGDMESYTVLQECCTEMDKLFPDICYKYYRRTNGIGPLELCIVGRGTFRRVLDCFVETGGNLGQFKTPRCINNETILGVLEASTVKRFRSTAYVN